MYIKAYDCKLSSPQFYVNNTQSGQNINKNSVLWRRSLSRTDRVYKNSNSISPHKISSLLQMLQTSPKKKSNKCAQFFTPNSFGVTFKSNRVRQMKARNKGVIYYISNEERRKNDQQIILKPQINESDKKMPMKNRQTKSSFSFSGNPTQNLRNLKVHTSLLKTKQAQVVLDFSKFVPLKRDIRYSTNPFIQPIFFQSQMRKMSQIFKAKHSGFEQETQPQILIDYRKSMSSGRKRQKKQIKVTETQHTQIQKINGWAVRNGNQDDQMIF